MNLNGAKRRLDALQPTWRDYVPPGYDPDEVKAWFVNAYRVARSAHPGLTVEAFFADLRRFIEV